MSTAHDHRGGLLARTTSPVFYLIIFGALLLLTAATVGVAYTPIGHWHTPAALVIAGGKAVLVVLFFMHVIHSSRLTWLVIGAALLMMVIGAVLTFADYLTRGWLPP
jgi:cytochrome c oxidase subunit 4